jgi:hypothetical protein
MYGDEEDGERRLEGFAWFIDAVDMVQYNRFMGVKRYMG